MDPNERKAMDSDFVAVLLEMRNGAVAADCSTKFTELVESVLETGKSGSLTLSIKVRPNRTTGMQVTEVELTHTCRAARPELDHGRSIFFVTKSRRLTRTDPNQMEMDLDTQSDTVHEEERRNSNG